MNITSKYTGIIFNFGFTFLVYGMLIKSHYSSDTYKILAVSNNSADIHLRDGRYLSALVYKLLGIINVNVALYQSILVIIFMISTAIIASILISYICTIIDCDETDKIKKIIIQLGVLIGLNNVFILEWYLFPECMLFYAISLSCAVLGAIMLAKGFRYSWLISFILVFVSLGTYQASLGFYVIIFSMLILIKFNFKLSKAAFMQLVLGLSISGANSILNVLITKGLITLKIMPPTDRGADFSLSNIISNSIKISEMQSSLWRSTYSLMPSFVMIIFVVLLVCIFLYYFFKQRLKITQLLLSISIILLGYVTIFIPHIVSSQLWVSHRAIAPFFMVLTALICMVTSLKPGLRAMKMLVFSALLFIFVSIYQIHDIIKNDYAVDRMDIEYAKLINNEIKTYEQNHKVRITKIATTLDENPSWTYRGIDYQIMDFNVRNLVRPWADVYLINKVNGENYQKIEMNKEVYDIYFSSKNWDFFKPSEQIIFIGETAYIAMF